MKSSPLFDHEGYVSMNGVSAFLAGAGFSHQGRGRWQTHITLSMALVSHVHTRQKVTLAPNIPKIFVPSSS